MWQNQWLMGDVSDNHKVNVVNKCKNVHAHQRTQYDEWKWIKIHKYKLTTDNDHFYRHFAHKMIEKTTGQIGELRARLTAERVSCSRFKSFTFGAENSVMKNKKFHRS